MLEAGHNDVAAAWSAVMALLAPHVRIVAYDRTGLGGSAPALPRDWYGVVADAILDVDKLYGVARLVSCRVATGPGPADDEDRAVCVLNAVLAD